MKKKKAKVFKVGNNIILKGERKRVQLDIAALYDYTKVTVPIEVIRGIEDGPTLFISAAIHGDEINGVEIIKRLLQKPILKKVRGTLILIPVVNVFGFNNKSRYLPDRRDLNRCFPGTLKGSLGSRIACIFMKEIVSKCTHGIDLHTGAIHRTNLPQIRACLDDPETERIARCFGAPVIIDSKLRDGSLREAARAKKVSSLVFEAGEALRFEEDIIKSGLSGCLSVMEEIGMIPKLKRIKKTKGIFLARDSFWIRAPHSGSFRVMKSIGNGVKAGETLAVISDTFGGEPYKVVANESGVIIGMSTIPLVNKGDAMVHIATFSNMKKLKQTLDYYDNDLL